MPLGKKIPPAARIDPDDAPELTDEWFKKADLHHGEKLVRRGRPKSAAPNVAVSLRIPPDVLERTAEGFAGPRAGAPGMNLLPMEIVEGSLRLGDLELSASGLPQARGPITFVALHRRDEASCPALFFRSARSSGWAGLEKDGHPVPSVC